ncbi:DUF3566 domain-containing protein [Modestobacter muralis]|uniref:DUF3566 domain-containing protein n=1 Tax=Modestobacter muralis TaxID=1608614 RepID=A0A6P0EPZ1_9ACTN|nr:DUF3566 domain-containing protein [Modestobacter muralis]NEK93811.1 DUF3566 domain-containing protein [Modestobacter muralis]NEN50578.1 DUF3566 domain-containing protein [Modestobacter muralis]
MSDRARSSVRTDSREGSGTADAEPAGASQVSDVPEQAPATSGGPDGAAAETPASPVAGGSTAATARPLAGQPTPADDARAAAAATPPVPPAVPPVTGQGNRISAGVRSAARSAAPVDATQSVTLPPAGVRPAEPTRPAEPVRPADTARPVEAPRAAAGPRTAGDGTRQATKGRRGPRRARLQLRHIDTWSALKISLVVSIALFFVWMVAVGVLYGVLSGLGVFDSVNDLIGQVSTSSGGAATESFTITAGLVFTGAAVIGAVNILLLTALCTVGTFVYNVCSDLVGGLELTLAERD